MFHIHAVPFSAALTTAVFIFKKGDEVLAKTGFWPVSTKPKKLEL